MLSWQVGALKITCVVEVLIPFPYDPGQGFLRDAAPEALKAGPWLYPHFVKEDGDHRISHELRLIPSIGHTPGHVSVMIESEGQHAVITGDITHHPCQLAHPEWATSFDSDKETATATRTQLFAEWADRPILVIGTTMPRRQLDA